MPTDRHTSFFRMVNVLGVEGLSVIIYFLFIPTVMKVSICISFLFIVCGLSGCLFPKFSFPPLSGSYKVGTQSLHLTDSTREESFTPTPNDKREIMLSLYYPIDAPSDTATALKYPESAVTVSQKMSGIPGFVLTNLENVETNSFVQKRLSAREQTFPLIIFSPGIGGCRFQYLFLIEQWVSQGYIVATIDHPYDAGYVQFPNGRSVDFKSAWPMAANDSVNQQQTQIRMDDITFVKGFLTKLNLSARSMFHSKIDMTRMALVGHSYGGTTITRILQQTTDFKAGISLEGLVFDWMVADPATAVVKTPFMNINASETFAHKPKKSELKQLRKTKDEYNAFFNSYRKNLQTLSDNAQKDYYWLWMQGAQHLSFTDVPLYSPIIDTKENAVVYHRIVVGSTICFLDQYLKGKKEQTVDAYARNYPEVTVKTCRQLSDTIKP